MNTFEQDVVAYLSALPKLVGEAAGQYALVGQGHLAKVFPSRDEALTAGYETFGAAGFLVQRISPHDLEMSVHWHHQ